jgi:ElaB/YqjD/DUF883 family membrane-anchored ribosome-binding protein
MRDQARVIGEDIGELGRVAKSAVQDKASSLAENARRHYDDAVSKVGDYEERFAEVVRDRPLRSLAIAAAVGVVLGALWSRR